MNTTDKWIIGILGIALVGMFSYGFKTSTGFAVASSSLAVKIGSIGAMVWVVVLLVLLFILLWLRKKKKDAPKIEGKKDRKKK